MFVPPTSSTLHRLTMPAPTALLRRPEDLANTESQAQETIQDTDTVLLDIQKTSQDPPKANVQTVEFHLDEEGRPVFPPTNVQDGPYHAESRKVPVPPHRMTPLRNAWSDIYPPLVEHLKLQVRMNTKSRAVELRTSKQTTDNGALQKGEDFVKAFTLGFDVRDAVALLRLDDLYIETFEIKDVKTLQGDHAGRAIGRIAGHDGRTKSECFQLLLPYRSLIRVAVAIENASKTRVVLADQKIHILGGFRNIHIAREAIVSLILGSPPGKVYGNLRIVASRMKERF